MRVLEPRAVGAVLDELKRRGYRPMGPTERDGAVVLGDLDSLDDLPSGLRDVQEPGRYRLEERGDGALFGYVVGPRSWKELFLPPVRRLWSVRREDAMAAPEPDTREDPAPLALIGARPCELAALAIQDRVLTGGAFVDPDYRARREGAFVVAVHCTEPGGTCFCSSMGTGPRASAGYDVALTEIADGDGPWLLAEASTDAGREVLAAVGGRPALDDEIRAASARVDAAAGRMGRRLDLDGLAEILARNDEHPRWDAVAERCLACGNCTQVCPTCFCHTVEDSTDLAGSVAFRTRRWDSCFTSEFSYIHGGSVRPSIRARYRQWLTHKLAHWHAQFESSGCVGCGRCITWCPVGIDLIEEARVIRDTEPFVGPRSREGAQ